MSYHEGSSFPVGKVDTLTLRPMTFLEFLLALSDELIVESLTWDELGRLAEQAEGPLGRTGQDVSLGKPLLHKVATPMRVGLTHLKRGT